MPTSSRRRQSSLAIGNGRRASSRGSVLGHESLERRACPAAFSLELPTTPIVEGDRATFTVRMAAPSTLPQRVAVSAISGSATLGNDFIFSNATQLLFSPGQTVKTFSVQTFTDSIPERSETFRITATPLNVPNAATISAQATIYDLVATTVTAGNVRVTEGNSGTVNATFTVTLGGQPILPVTVLYSTRDVTATAGSDYTATSGSVVFRPGETTKTFTVAVTGDTIAEFDETYQVLLSSPTRGCTVTTPTLTGTIVNDEQDTVGFQITLSYANPALPASQKAVFESAAARLQQIIVGDVPGVTLPSGQFIDDIRMQVYVEAMDPSINGFARILQSRPGGLPYEGEIRINSARIGNPGIYHTIIHEYLHALGFSASFFSNVNLVTGLGTPQPLFTGANARREYGSAFAIAAPAGVPLYGDLSAQGSYGSHWDTGTFGTEIMSVGWDTMSNALRPFSRITVGAMQDLGYQVNYGAADQFTPPRDSVLMSVTPESRPTGPRTSINFSHAPWAVAPTPPVAVRTTSSTTPSTPAFGKAAPRASVAAVPAAPSVRMTSTSYPSKTPRVFVRL
jgi:hypothetical protein